MKSAFPITALVLSAVLCSDAREPKETDHDINYKEEKLPHYDLPPLLVTSQGKRITTAEEWHTIRRPEILSLFSNLVYGRVPEPASPLEVEFEVVKTDPQFMKGKATRKDVKIHLSNEKGRMSMHFLVFVPNGAKKPVPAFLKHSFNNTQNDDIDHTRVAIMGHSKMGKTALWTAAQDERFALAISAQSGCAGAALWRRKSGETLKKMVTRFPYWLCRNAWKFVEQEDDLPVDQHMLLACIAPRPVYVHSGVEDTWADGRGEYLSAYHAGEVYRLLGKKALATEESPPAGKAIIESQVGYHIREGGHSIDRFDWERFLDFADYHLNAKPE